MEEFNEKQIEILNVAESLFAEVGFDGTSIRDIAKKANINIAMISYYFGSKDKLLEALLLYRMSGMALHLENLLQENIPPIQKVEKLVELYIKKIHKNRAMYQILQFEMSTNKRGLDIEEFKKVKNTNLATITKIIKEGQDQNIFSKDVIIPLIPTTVIGTYFHFQMNKPYYKELFEIETDLDYENYNLNELTKHLQKTIKALLTYEN
jgi:AcrR family transcriptional regulator